MRLFGWFRKKPVKEDVPLPVHTPRAPVGSLEHAQKKLKGQIAAQKKWQALVEAGQGHGRKSHEECVATLKAVADTPFQGYPNKIEYWQAQVTEAQDKQITWHEYNGIRPVNQETNPMTYTRAEWDIQKQDRPEDFIEEQGA